MPMSTANNTTQGNLSSLRMCSESRDEAETGSRPPFQSPRCPTPAPASPQAAWFSSVPGGSGGVRVRRVADALRLIVGSVRPARHPASRETPASGKTYTMPTVVLRRVRVLDVLMLFVACLILMAAALRQADHSSR